MEGRGVRLCSPFFVGVFVGSVGDGIVLSAPLKSTCGVGLGDCWRLPKIRHQNPK
jgi:hypothetical protein